MNESATDKSDGQNGILPQTKIDQLKEELCKDWSIRDGHLEKEIKFKDFREALAYTNKVGEIAESMGHHPDIYLTWGQVKLTIWTHSKGGLTSSDFMLATKIDTIQ